MAEGEQTEAVVEQTPMSLRNPGLAAFLAWLVPGAGHWYQGRRGKAILFAVCVLGTYVYGLVIGDGHVVYASWNRTDFRWQYVCQLGVGLPAMPALVQSRRVMRDKEPLFADVLAPPRQPVYPGEHDHLADWHLELSWRFDLGTLYTMVAGLLNILAVFDAYSGPFIAHAIRAKSIADATRERLAAEATAAAK
jgi:hypothetical protein